MMAIVLYTGLPGSGKTLRSIFDALKKKTEEGRPVFHIGIDGMDPEFIPVAPISGVQEWMKLPPGSILIVDEAHKFFPVRSPGKPPEWIQTLTEIRHFGIELWLVTQDPRNIDSFVRRLVGVHFHLTRKAGFHGAMIREFQGVSENPDDFSNRQSSSQTPWRYPKHLFQVYKSATLHVTRPKIPKKVLFALLLFVLCLVGLPIALWTFSSKVDTLDDPSSSSPSVVGQAAQAGSASPSDPPVSDPWASQEAFLKAHLPLVPYVPHSAPIYSGSRPVAIPEIYCVASGLEGSKDRTCNCYTEQATRMPGVPSMICENYVKNGTYNPYRPRPVQASLQPREGVSVDDAPAAFPLPVEPIAP